MKIAYYKNEIPTKKQLEKFKQKFLINLNSKIEGKTKLGFYRTFNYAGNIYFVFYYGKTLCKNANNNKFISDLLYIKDFYFMQNCLIVKSKNTIFNLKSFPKLVEKIYTNNHFSHFISELENIYI